MLELYAKFTYTMKPVSLMMWLSWMESTPGIVLGPVQYLCSRGRVWMFLVMKMASVLLMVALHILFLLQCLDGWAWMAPILLMIMFLISMWTLEVFRALWERVISLLLQMT